MNKIIFASLVLFAPLAYADPQTAGANPDFKIGPTLCEMPIKAIPECSFTIQAKKGMKIEPEVFMHKKLSTYVDSPSIYSGNFEKNSTDDVQVTPLTATYDEDGIKQFRFVYLGTLTPELTDGELYGRVIIAVTKENAVPITATLPLFISTAKNQKADISEVKIGESKDFIVNDGGKISTLKIARITIENKGSASMALSHVSFKDKPVKDYKLADFNQLSAIIMPHSTATIEIPDPKFAAKFKQAEGSTITLVDRRNGKFVEVRVTR